MTQTLQETKTCPWMDPPIHVGKNYPRLGTRIRFRAAHTSGNKLGVEDREQRKQCWLFWKQL